MAVTPRCAVVPWALCAGWLLAGCAEAPAQKPMPAPVTGTAVDWRSLAILPFGSPLQDLQERNAMRWIPHRNPFPAGRYNPTCCVLRRAGWIAWN